mmetsp:Transcript_142357/g.370847  ORF Transcript_142357/g.370847 Transcript_142357/m.370847 type:complete len:145 (-) Transcript_142357:371-805(-)
MLHRDQDDHADKRHSRAHFWTSQKARWYSTGQGRPVASGFARTRRRRVCSPGPQGSLQGWGLHSPQSLTWQSLPPHSTSSQAFSLCSEATFGFGAQTSGPNVLRVRCVPRPQVAEQCDQSAQSASTHFGGKRSIHFCFSQSLAR